jgi:hypothetical protein
MKIEDFTLVQQAEIKARHPDLDFQNHFYEFTPDQSIVPMPKIIDRYDDEIKLGERCLLAKSIGRNDICIMDCIFVGFNILKQDGQPRKIAMIVLRELSANRTTRIRYQKKSFFGLINMEKRFQ